MLFSFDDHRALLFISSRLNEMLFYSLLCASFRVFGCVFGSKLCQIFIFNHEIKPMPMCVCVKIEVGLFVRSLAMAKRKIVE